MNHEQRRRIGIVASQESSNVVSQERLVDAGRDGCAWKRVNVEALLVRETKSVKEFGKAGIAQLGLAIVAHMNHHPRSRTARDETEGVGVVGIIEDDQPKLGEDRDVAVACAYAGRLLGRERVDPKWLISQLVGRAKKRAHFFGQSDGHVGDLAQSQAWRTRGAPSSSGRVAIATDSAYCDVAGFGQDITA